MENTQKSYKVVLVGDSGVGKTAFVKRILTGEFEKKHVATIGVEVHPLVLHTNKGSITYKIWDCAGEEKFGGLRDGYYIQMDCAIILCDVHNKQSINNVAKWHKSLRRIDENVPIIICGNKADDFTSQTPEYVNDMEFIKINVLNNSNLDRPFLSLAKKLTGDDSIKFIKTPAISEHEISETHLVPIRSWLEGY